MELHVAQKRDDIIDRLVAIVHELPEDKAAEILDFASFLHGRYTRPNHPRGSAEAILAAIDRVGPLEFEPGELEKLLTEIERQRELDLA